MRLLNMLKKCSSYFNSSNYLIQFNQSKRYFSRSFVNYQIVKGFQLSQEVESALHQKCPIVALESAIITHGMPYPFNYQTALDVEEIIRQQGAIPATIGVIDGKIHVGLSLEQIEFLSTCNKNCVKVSKRDFAYVLANKLHGGTTVAGTVAICASLGLPIFATGGIGGVHHGGQTSMDVSADLLEMGRCPVSVVCAGVKSILDVGRTLEVLETQGVCVVCLSKSKAFPDFFTRDSGFEAPYQASEPQDVACMIRSCREIGLRSGMLVAVPIPLRHEAEGEIVKKAINMALKECEGSVRGRDVTPFVLRRVAELTDGKSLIANIALVKNNAEQAARIAVQYSQMEKTKSEQRMPTDGTDISGSNQAVR